MEHLCLFTDFGYIVIFKVANCTFRHFGNINFFYEYVFCNWFILLGIWILKLIVRLLIFEYTSPHCFSGCLGKTHHCFNVCIYCKQDLNRLHTGVEVRHVCVYCLLENRASLLTNRHNAVYQFISASSVSCLSDNIKSFRTKSTEVRITGLSRKTKQNMQLVYCLRQDFTNLQK